MKGAKPHLVVDNGAISKATSAPQWMSDDAKKEWKRVLPILVARRILTTPDLGGLENYCVAIGTVREMERTIQAQGYTYEDAKGTIKRHPAVAIQAEAMTRARLLAAELGLTPVSRSRPAVREAGDDDDDINPLDF